MNREKAIAIARAIEYKEIAKRNAERERECKRRGLWVLWCEQSEYKTLWHFLRASDKRLIEVCYNTIDDLNKRNIKLALKRNELMQANKRCPCLDTYKQLDLINQQAAEHARSRYQISIIIDKLTGGNSNENQN